MNKILFLFLLFWVNISLANINFDVNIFDKNWDEISKKESSFSYCKFIIDYKTKKIIFFNPNGYALHADFVFKELKKIKPEYSDYIEYNKNYDSVKPEYILGYLSKYNFNNEFVFSFWEGDAITYYDIQKTNLLLKKFALLNKISFRPDSLEQEKLSNSLKKLNVNVVFNDDLFKKNDYLPYNLGETIGILRFVDTKDRDILKQNVNDIVVLKNTYLDITPVKGIISKNYTPILSHINIRANNWNIPNVIFNDIDSLYKFNNKAVYIKATKSNFYIRLASLKEINKLSISNPINKVKIDDINLLNTNISNLNFISEYDRSSYGTKTTNLGIMCKIKNLNVPIGFGIPFYYYNHYLTDDIKFNIDNLKNIHDDNQLKLKLLEIQKQIKSIKLSDDFKNELVSKWTNELGKEAIFVRSSTSVEDLKNFSGAGLYDSVANVTTEDGLENAIKVVWASLWNYRAYKEREFFNINQNENLAVGVLIQKGVKADAAGVLITKDLFNGNPNSYTINANFGFGMKVVDGEKIPEQTVYDYGNNGLRIISKSNENSMLIFDKEKGLKEVSIAKKDFIVSKKIAIKIGTQARIIEQYFNHTMDIEWVLEKDKIWIVQARYYN